MVFENLPYVTKSVVTILLIYLGYKCLQIIYGFLQHLKRIVYIRRHLPGPSPHWLYGNIFDPPGILTPGLEWHLNAVNSYRRLLVYWVGWKPVVMLNHPDTVRDILSSTTGSVKAPMYQLFHEWIKNGLGVMEGALWKRHRRLITNSFHFSILKRYVVIMNEVANTLVRKLSNIADSGDSLIVHEVMTCYSCDVILQCAFSYKSHCQEQQSKYVSVIDTLTETIVYRTFNPLLFWDFFFRLSPKYNDWKNGIRYMHSLQEKLIAERRKKYEELGEDKVDRTRMDFLDTLLMAHDSAGEGLANEEIRDEVSAFVFAGMDTTSSALTWLLFLLAKHPKYQTKLQAEIDEVLQDRDTDDIRYDDLHKLPFVIQCIRESMRLYVFVPPYRLLTAPLHVDGITIPVGTEIMINNYQLHHNPDVWGDDHMDFKPSRFDRENVSKQDPFAFLPFAAGHRNCIGQQFAIEEMQVTTARIFRRFSVTLVKEAKPVFKVVTKPDEPMLLKLHPRADI